MQDYRLQSDRAVLGPPFFIPKHFQRKSGSGFAVRKRGAQNHLISFGHAANLRAMNTACTITCCIITC